MRICSIGECMIELSSTNNGKYTLGYAGDSANTAIYLSRLGAHSSYITSVGNDKFSKSMINFFDKEKVKTNNIYINKKETIGLYLIDNRKNGERDFFYWRKNSAAKTYFENINYKSLLNKICKFDAIYFSGITLSIYNSKNIVYFYRLLKLAKLNGIKIYFDFNVRLNNWHSSKLAKQLILKFSKISDTIFLTNEDRINLKIRSYEKFILKYYKNQIVIFRNGNGIISIYNNNKFNNYNLKFNKKVIDTTGCGDAFNACFLYNYFNNNEIKDCINNAHKLGMHVAMSKGAIMRKEKFNKKNYTI